MATPPIPLVFERTAQPGQPVVLRFGEESGAPKPERAARLVLTLPKLQFAAHVCHPARARMVVQLPPLVVAATGDFDSGVSRPLTRASASTMQTAARAHASAGHRMQDGQPLTAQDAAPWGRAQPQPSSWVDASAAMLPRRTSFSAQHPDAAPLAMQRRLDHQIALLQRASRQGHHQDAVFAEQGWRAAHQDMRFRRSSAAAAHAEALLASHIHAGRFQTRALVASAWRMARHQDAMRPPIGRWRQAPPSPPAQSPCYAVSSALVFESARALDAQLVFVCERVLPPLPPGAVVVPVRRFYMVLNDVHVVRVSDAADVPVTAVTLTLDADSWAWGFTASLPASALPLVQPGATGPVELFIHVNGQPFHVLAEQVARERRFGSQSVRISGRGRHALLDAPYAPQQSFANSTTRTSQQLMDDALTLNGVPLGWTIDWGLDAWQVPAGAWSQQGSPIDALASIAAASGGYLIPHANAKSFKVRHRYPVAPWDWPSAVPEIVLPSAVVTREAFAWREKPAYNRVFVSGQAQGVLGQVTRQGTAGDLAAPMVVDALITEASAARQRGLAVLADTGRQLMVDLRLPVLPLTGVIHPGAIVRYEDGPNVQTGIVRAVNIDAPLPDLWQTITVETRP